MIPRSTIPLLLTSMACQPAQGPAFRPSGPSLRDTARPLVDDTEADTDSDSDADTDADADADADAELPDVELGVVTVSVPSAAAPDGGIAARVFYPSTGARRYAAGAPIVVDVQGGWSANHSIAAEPTEEVEAHGIIQISYLLPGGVAPEMASGGVYDVRGEDCIRATADVLRFAAGDLADAEGQLITDHVPHALTSNVGIAAGSNGGNLAIAALAQHGDEVDVQWLAAWESPLGDQYATVELNDNPFYEPGTCDATTCPIPGLADALAWDSGGPPP